MTEWLDIAEFQQLGYLQEANRLTFHRFGLALSARRVKSDWTDEEIAGSEWMQARMYDVGQGIAAQASETVSGDVAFDEDIVTAMARSVCRRLWPQGSMSLVGVMDVRSDPEGMVFGDWDEEMIQRARQVERERGRHFNARCDLFGIQKSYRYAISGGDIEPIGWTPKPGQLDD